MMEEMNSATEKGLRAEMDRKVSKVQKEKSDMMLKIKEFDRRIDQSIA